MTKKPHFWPKKTAVLAVFWKDMDHGGLSHLFSCRKMDFGWFWGLLDLWTDLWVQLCAKGARLWARNTLPYNFFSQTPSYIHISYTYFITWYQMMIRNMRNCHHIMWYHMILPGITWWSLGEFVFSLPPLVSSHHVVSCEDFHHEKILSHHMIPFVCTLVPGKKQFYLKTMHKPKTNMI